MTLITLARYQGADAGRVRRLRALQRGGRICMCIYIYMTYVYVSLSLSIYIYMYIEREMYMYIHMYTDMFVIVYESIHYITFD